MEKKGYSSLPSSPELESYHRMHFSVISRIQPFLGEKILLFFMGYRQRIQSPADR